MPNFPVDSSDLNNLAEAVNYALSGPSGLGQNVNSFSTSQPAWFIGGARSPTTRPPQASSEAVGGQGLSTITCFNPTNIEPGLYAIGYGIAPGAQVAVTYNPATPSVVPLTIANTGPVTATVNFYEYPGPDNLNITPIGLASIVQLDAFTVQATFAAPQPTPPFRPSQTATVAGTTVAGYNRQYTGPGVVECTTTTVTLKSAGNLGTLAPATGGTIRNQLTIAGPAIGVSTTQGSFQGTDVNRVINVNSITDKLIVSANLNSTFTWTSPGTTTLLVRTVLVRSVSFPTQDFQSQTGFLFDQQALIAENNLTQNLTAGTGTFTNSVNFGTIIDTLPAAGYYFYRVAMQFRNITSGGTAQVTSCTLGSRSMSVQVVKL